MIFLLIIFLFVSLDLWVWRRAEALLAPVHRRWRLLGRFFIFTMMLCLLAMIFTPRVVVQNHRWIPRPVGVAVYIWHLLVLPLTAIAFLITGVSQRLSSKFRKQPAPVDPPTPPLITRRRMLGMAALSVPPLATVSLACVAMRQLGKFRVKSYDLAIPGWPAALNGFTLGVVADVHTGVFTSTQMLQDISDAANNLRADLMLLPGDLINASLDDLPTGLDMVMRLQARHGIYMIQGNHDVLQSAEKFNARVKARGVPLLLDEAQTIRPRGVPLQILGVKWPKHGLDSEMEQSIATVAKLRDPDAFPILMTHHPDAWDYAKPLGFPLVLAGHTHGGQIMLTKNIGGGPLRFKYWTGLYQSHQSNLIVSNGVGNWFPVRINAPAEILRITLHAAV